MSSQVGKRTGAQADGSTSMTVAGSRPRKRMGVVYGVTAADETRGHCRGDNSDPLSVLSVSSPGDEPVNLFCSFVQHDRHL